MIGSPFFTSLPVSNAVQDVAYSYTMTAGDVDTGTTLSFNLVNGPDWLTFSVDTISGTPGNSEGMIWKAMMHNDHGDSHYSTLKDGQLVTYRGTPGNQEATPYMTPAVPGPGPYKLGITVSKRLVIFSEIEGEKPEVVWKSEILEKWRL